MRDGLVQSVSNAYNGLCPQNSGVVHADFCKARIGRHVHLFTNRHKPLSWQNRGVFCASEAPYPVPTSVSYTLWVPPSPSPQTNFSEPVGLELTVLVHDAALPVKKEKRVVKALALSPVYADDHVGVILLCQPSLRRGFARHLHRVEIKLRKPL